MPKYLVQASYTHDGAKGLLKDGGTARRAAVEQMVTGMGGRLEGVYFAFGDADAYVILDAPEYVTGGAVSLAFTRALL